MTGVQTCALPIWSVPKGTELTDFDMVDHFDGSSLSNQPFYKFAKSASCLLQANQNPQPSTTQVWYTSTNKDLAKLNADFENISLVVASGGYSSLRCAGFSLWWLLLLWSMGSRHAGSSSCGMQAQ